MFGRDAVTNLSQLTKPKLGYMGTEDLILDLELMSSIFQTQIHNLRMARECVINVALKVSNLLRNQTSMSETFYW